jgi:hypothetical protein
MPYQIKIEIVPSKRDDALLNEAYDYLNFTNLGCDPDTEKDANNFLQFIFKIIAIRHGLEPMRIKEFHGELHDDFLELRSGKISLKEKRTYDFRDFL